MGFMQKQIEYGEWVQVDGPCGLDSIPADIVNIDRLRELLAVDRDDDESSKDEAFSLVSDYTENRRADSIEIVTGYGARMSAPGYLDCTEWAVFDTADEADEYLNDYYGDDDPEAE